MVIIYVTAIDGHHTVYNVTLFEKCAIAFKTEFVRKVLLLIVSSECVIVKAEKFVIKVQAV